MGLETIGGYNALQIRTQIVREECEHADHLIPNFIFLKGERITDLFTLGLFKNIFVQTVPNSSNTHFEEIKAFLSFYSLLKRDIDKGDYLIFCKITLNKS